MQDAPRSAKLFVAVGHDGLRMTAVDGLSWSNVKVGKEGEVYRGVVIGDGRCAAVGSYGGSNIFAGSHDGVNWKTKVLDAKYSKYLRGIVYGAGEFIAVGGDPGSVGSSGPLLVRSRDGLVWSDYLTFSGKNILRRIAYGNGRFVGVGDRGRRATSTDGLTWVDMPDVKAIDTLVDVAFGAGVFVGVGLHGLRMSTRDGLKWDHRQVGEEGEHLNSVVWTGAKFVAVGAGATYESTDGEAWTRTPNHDAPLVVAHGEGVFVGSSWRGRILRSTDAIDWKLVHKSEQHVEAITFGTLG
jgi:hypothetical protein